jgi:hypothetical protein
VSYADLSWPAAGPMQVLAAANDAHLHVMGLAQRSGSFSPPPVTPADYLWAPVLAGVIAVIVLVVLTGVIGVPCVDGEVVRTARLFNRKFWSARFYASAAWTFKDSGATNVTALGTAIAAVLATGTTLTAILPKVDVNPFIVMNVACGGIVAAAPLFFAIANIVFSRHYPMAPADATVTLTAPAALTVPSGASIAVPGGAAIEGAGHEEIRVKAGGTIPVPPGTSITIGSGTLMGLPSGTAVAIGAGGTLTMNAATRIAASDLVPGPAPAGRAGHRFRRAPQAPPPPADTQVHAADRITVTTGAVASVVGVADIHLDAGTTILAPGHRGMQLKNAISITVPSNSNVIAAGMRSLLSAAAVTTFGIAMEIGLIAVLAIRYARLTGPAHAAAWVIPAVAGIGLIVYGATAIRALADPTPGSSMGAGSGTSFTL